MTIVIVCEKPSAARNFAKALGGAAGTYKGEAYKITNLRGHLLEHKQPEKMVAASRVEDYKSWELGKLPWDHTELSWEKEPREGASGTISDVRKALTGASEIVIATDVDPSGEGFLLASELLLEYGIGKGTKISRMYFLDEAPKSIQDGFVNRKVVPDIEKHDEHLMADTRSRWDYLSMQFTRVATKSAGQRSVLRQGRLKSAMVLLVGDGLKAYNDYVKKPYFTNKFRDENDVVYTNVDEPRFESKAEVPASYNVSDVVLDGRENKRTAPPKLLDLAGLSAILASKGVKAAEVLKVYQGMYEAQIVSYPRTEDRVVTPEQFNELLPKIDAIADVVGADKSLLTHRKPRATHVKTGGAHGANRPGLTVPKSLDELKAKFGPVAPLIYETLAKNYLRILAEDYVYEQQKGHVKDYPAFVGTANLPKSMGWKAVFDDSAGDEVDEDENVKGLGTKASPFVYEGANKRPPHPTMKWLMQQLEKRDVGTGATRTSIYADVTNAKTKFPLLVESRGKLTLADPCGEQSYRMLPGTRIADLEITERLNADMKAVAKGTKSADDVLAEVAEMIRADIATMAVNAVSMAKELDLKPIVTKEKAEGTFKGQQITFTREWSGHRFTDAEVADLLAGKEIEVKDFVSAKTGSKFGAKGKLAEQTYKGKKFFGFKSTGFLDTGEIPASYLGHKFTAKELEDLKAGKTIEVKGYTSKAGKKFDAPTSWSKKDGEDKEWFQFHFAPRK